MDRHPDTPNRPDAPSIPLTAEAAQRIVPEAIDRAPDVVLIHRPDGKLLYANRAACAHYGICPESLAELPPWGWTSTSPEAIADRCARLRHRRELAFLEGVQHSDGDRFYEVRARLVESASGDLVVAISRDVTERVEAEQRLRQMAFRDPLTGLANRTLLEDRLGLAIHDAARHGDFLGVLYVDIDDFKPVNDTYGHDAGDRVLKVIAERMKTAVRAEDTVARVGGDEFVIVLPRLATADDVEVAARRVRDAIALPIEIGDTLCTVSASVGHALYDPQADDVHSLMIRADLAMYHARRHGTAIEAAEPLG